MKAKKLLNYALLSGLALSLSHSLFAQPAKRFLQKIDHRQSRLMEKKKQFALLSFNHSANYKYKGTQVQSRLTAYASALHDGAFFIPMDSSRLHWSGERNNELFPLFLAGEILPYAYFKDYFLKPRVDYDISNTDSTEYYLWDKVKSEYVYDSKTISVLNDKGLVTSEILYVLDGTAWKNHSKTIYTYDANTNLIGFEREIWDGTVWEKSDKDVYRYDDKNNLITEVYLHWDNTGSKWDSTYKYVYDYDNADNWISTISQRWAGTDWENDWRDRYTYVSNQIESYIEQSWDVGTSSWENYYKDEFDYNSSDQLTDIISFDWGVDKWEERSKETFTYSADKQTSAIYHSWSGSKWDYEDRAKYIYANDLLTEVQVETWDNASDKFVPELRFNISYNSFDQFKTFLSEEWNGSDWESVKNDFKLSLYYEEYDDDGVGINEVKDIAFDIYPNPAHNSIYVKTTDQKVERIRIMDMNGKVVFESKVNLNAEEINIPVRNLANGSYILQVQGKNNLNGNKLFVVNNR